MSKASGLVFVLAGLGLAAQVMPSGLQTGASEPTLESEIAKIPPAGVARVAAVPPPSAAADNRASPPIVAPKPQPAVRAPTQAAVPTPPPPAPVVITLARRAAEPPAAAPAKAAAIPDRATLARELQRELRRVGCYDGEINGAWTIGTKRAMKSFTDRVNATLPVEEPDYILLTLVQGHQDKACGKPCPVEQALSDDGRCVPNAILARAKKPASPANVAAAPNGSPPSERPQPAITGWSTTTTAAIAPPTEGRMALAGPKADTAPVLGSLAPGPGPALRHGPVPPGRVYDRRPPPPRYVQRSRDPGWGRAMFQRIDSSR